MKYRCAFVNIKFDIWLSGLRVLRLSLHFQIQRVSLTWNHVLWEMLYMMTACAPLSPAFYGISLEGLLKTAFFFIANHRWMHSFTDGYQYFIFISKCMLFELIFWLNEYNKNLRNREFCKSICSLKYLSSKYYFLCKKGNEVYSNMFRRSMI